MTGNEPPSTRAAGASTFVRLSVLYGALFVIFGAQLTYLPVWLDARGLSAAEIAFASSAPMFLRLAVTPSIAFLADRGQAHRAMIQGLCLAALVLLYGLAQSTSTLAIMVLVVMSTIAVQSIMPLTDTIAMKAARHEGVDYGRMRLWGSVTFIAASYLAGYVIVRWGAEALIWLLVVGGLATAAAALWLPRQAMPSAAGSAPRLTLADVISLLRGRTFVLFLLCSGAIQASHAMLYVFGVLHWRSLGMSAGFIGTLWAISVAAEVALFWAARRVAFIGPVELMLAGGLCGLIRWTVMAVDPAVGLLVPLQLLHAGTYAATHLGAMNWISRNVPDYQAGSAQALLSTFTAGISMGLAMLASGPLYAHYSGAGYLAMTLLAVVGIAAGLTLRKAGGRASDTLERNV